MLIELIDGGIKKILDDSWAEGGCETCDYGSSYVNEYIFKMINGSFKVEADQMYEHALSDGDMMKIMLQNIDEIKTLTEDGFTIWLKEKVLEIVDEDEVEFEYKKDGEQYEF